MFCLTSLPFFSSMIKSKLWPVRPTRVIVSFLLLYFSGTILSLQSWNLKPFCYLSSIYKILEPFLNSFFQFFLALLLLCFFLFSPISFNLCHSHPFPVPLLISPHLFPDIQMCVLPTWVILVSSRTYTNLFVWMHSVKFNILVTGMQLACT